MLNISKQIHAGWDNSKVIPSQSLHIAEIIPDGQSKTELKKLEKFTQTYPDVITVDNVPLPGFTILSVNKKKYSAPDSTWVVIDPRGFSTRITNKNMLSILRASGITEGLIQQKCIWAREDSDTEMTLVPMSSDAYELAVGNTKLIESRVAISDVHIGDKVLLQNGLQGRYMGIMSLYTRMNMSYTNVLKAQSKLRKQVIEILPGKFHYGTDTKILKIVLPAERPISKIESMEYINNCINNNINHYFSQGEMFTASHQNHYENIKCVSIHAEPKIKIRLEEITADDAKIFAEQISSNDMLLLEDANGTKYVIEGPWFGPFNIDIKSVPVKSVVSMTNNEIVIDNKDYNSMCAPTYTPNGLKKTARTYSFDNFKKFYKIVKCVRTTEYI